jgi:predicted double-glycine peptidase
MILTVPYFPQFHPDACGAAALEMVYRYARPSRLSKFSQKKIFQNVSELEPHQTGRYRISTDDLVEAAKRRGLEAGWGRVDPTPDELMKQIACFIAGKKVPLIACQRSHEDPAIGHFRVLFGVEGNEIILHDPDVETGGPNLRWTVARLIEHWRWSGENVTGGVAIWVAREVIDCPLADDLPNAWREH